MNTSPSAVSASISRVPAERTPWARRRGGPVTRTRGGGWSLTARPSRLAPGQHGAELAGVAAADRQLIAADDHADATALAAHLLDVGERDQHGAVDPHEA